MDSEQQDETPEETPDERVLGVLTGQVIPESLDTFPPCPQHHERQHRDRNPPWCRECGWSRGLSAIAPRKYR